MKTTSLKKIKKLTFVKHLSDKLPQAEIYLVGGSVRDYIIGKEEIHDLDFVICKVEMKDLCEVLNQVGTLGIRGKKYGSLKFLPKGKKWKDYSIDISLPRKEKSKRPRGKRTSFNVEFGPNISLKQDLSRRDLTINAIAYDIRKDKLVDPFSGMKDLKSKKIRCLGSISKKFEEDHSRILRAIRFAVTFDFKFERKTESGIKNSIKKIKNKKTLTLEMAAQEFGKTLKISPAKTAKLYFEFGLIHKFFPELASLEKIKDNHGKRAEDNYWDLTVKSLEFFEPSWFSKSRCGNPCIDTIISVLLMHLGVGKKASFNYFGKSAKKSRKFCMKYHLPSGMDIKCNHISWLLSSLDKLVLHQNKLRMIHLEKLFYHSNHSYHDLLQLIYIYDSICNRYRKNKCNLLKSVKSLGRKIKHKKLPQPLIDAHVLRSEFKIKASEKIKYYLGLVRDEQLKGKLKTRIQAEKFLSKKI